MKKLVILNGITYLKNIEFIFLSELFHSKLLIFLLKLLFEIIFFRINSLCIKSFFDLFFLSWLVGFY